MIQQIMLPERHQHMAGEAGMVQESQAVGQHAAEDQKAPGWRLGKMMKNGCQELPRKVILLSVIPAFLDSWK